MVCFSSYLVESWNLVYRGVIPLTLAPERMEVLLLAGKPSRASLVLIVMDEMLKLELEPAEVGAEAG